MHNSVTEVSPESHTKRILTYVMLVGIFAFLSFGAVLFEVVDLEVKQWMPMVAIALFAIGVKGRHYVVKSPGLYFNKEKSAIESVATNLLNLKKRKTFRLQDIQNLECRTRRVRLEKGRYMLAHDLLVNLKSGDPHIVFTDGQYKEGRGHKTEIVGTELARLTGLELLTEREEAGSEE